MESDIGDNSLYFDIKLLLDTVLLVLILLKDEYSVFLCLDRGEHEESDLENYAHNNTVMESDKDGVMPCK